MSWQRILEAARRQGMPVIVTDIAGREPMVLLPFDRYERMLETGSPLADDEAEETEVPFDAEDYDDADIGIEKLNEIAMSEAAEVKESEKRAVERESAPDVGDELSRGHVLPLRVFRNLVILYALIFIDFIFIGLTRLADSFVERSDARRRINHTPCSASRVRLALHPNA